MQLFLAVTPDHLGEASRFTDRLAHVAYRIGSEGHLLRQNLLARIQGGLMVLGDDGQGPIPDAAALCREVWRECANRNYGGVVADFEGEVRRDRSAFLMALGEALGRSRRRLFVPEGYGTQVPQAAVLICTAISGGTLRRRLEEAAQQLGTGRLALDLQRLRMDFRLPCPSGEGTPLTAEALSARMERRKPSVFYSGDLCAKYFTDTEGKESHFILFDDADTLRRKIQLGRELGISTGLLMYPEVEDLLPRLFSPAPRGTNKKRAP